MAHNSSSKTSSAAASLEVAIVGGGVIGVMMAMGLHRRGIKAIIYERAPTYHEVSAGFAFTGTGRDCMEKLHPGILEVLGKISQKTDADTSNSYWDAYHPRTKEESEDESKSLLFRTPNNKLDYWGCVRSQLLLGCAAQLPKEGITFGKQLVGYEDKDTNSKVVLRFDDGTTAEADVLVGCDGIHSKTRENMLGADHPASHAGYTDMVAYRTMVPIDAGIAALGDKVARSGCMHTGPNACLMTYPVMNGTLLNVAIFAHDTTPFPDPVKMTAPAHRSEISKLLVGWGPHLANIADLYPEKMVKWGLFDMTDAPPPTYACGRVCIVGDAAHASTPFLGVGACTGVEDALVLCTVLESLPQKTPAGLKSALQTYSMARLKRGRWVHSTSRGVGEMCQWRYGPTGRDPERMKMALQRNAHAAVDYDVLGALDAVAEIPAP
jgi:salicylate hydroxylase